MLMFRRKYNPNFCPNKKIPKIFPNKLEKFSVIDDKFSVINVQKN